MRRIGQIGVLLVMVVLGVALPAQAWAIGTCNDPGNLTFNCDFNTFADVSSEGNLRQIPEGWWYWIEDGTPAFQVGQDSTNPPSLQVWSDGGSFRVGVYQKINNVTPGATYVAGVDWAVYTPADANIMKQIGIDPLGGDSPFAPSVVWGEQNFDQNAFMRMRQSVVAQSTSITFFIRVANNGSNGAEMAFIDGAWVVQDTSIPNQNVPGPTATLAPPTAEATATIAPTLAPVATETPLPTSIPSNTAVVPSATTVPATEIPPSATAVPPSATRVPASATVAPPTATRPLPTATFAIPTATRLVPSATPVPPTQPAVEPTATTRPTIEPTLTRFQGTPATSTPARATRTATATATPRIPSTPRPTSTIEPTVTQFTIAAAATPNALNQTPPDAPTEPSGNSSILGGLNPLAVGGLGAVVVAVSGAAFVMMRQRQL